MQLNIVYPAYTSVIKWSIIAFYRRIVPVENTKISNFRPVLGTFKEMPTQKSITKIPVFFHRWDNSMLVYCRRMRLVEYSPRSPALKFRILSLIAEKALAGAFSSKPVDAFWIELK